MLDRRSTSDLVTRCHSLKLSRRLYLDCLLALSASSQAESKVSCHFKYYQADRADMKTFEANEILESGRADAIMLARELLRNADFVFDAAQGEGDTEGESVCTMSLT